MCAVIHTFSALLVAAAFPNSEWIDPVLEKTKGAHFSECAKGHVAMRPKRGKCGELAEGRSKILHRYHSSLRYLHHPFSHRLAVPPYSLLFPYIAGDAMLCE